MRAVLGFELVDTVQTKGTSTMKALQKIMNVVKAVLILDRAKP